MSQQKVDSKGGIQTEKESTMEQLLARLTSLKQMNKMGNRYWKTNESNNDQTEQDKGDEEEMNPLNWKMSPLQGRLGTNANKALPPKPSLLDWLVTIMKQVYYFMEFKHKH